MEGTKRRSEKRINKEWRSERMGGQRGGKVEVWWDKEVKRTSRHQEGEDCRNI